MSREVQKESQDGHDIENPPMSVYRKSLARDAISNGTGRFSRPIAGTGGGTVGGTAQHRSPRTPTATPHVNVEVNVNVPTREGAASEGSVARYTGNPVGAADCDDDDDGGSGVRKGFKHVWDAFLSGKDSKSRLVLPEYYNVNRSRYSNELVFRVFQGMGVVCGMIVLFMTRRGGLLLLPSSTAGPASAPSRAPRPTLAGGESVMAPDAYRVAVFAAVCYHTFMFTVVVPWPRCSATLYWMRTNPWRWVYCACVSAVMCAQAALVPGHAPTASPSFALGLGLGALLSVAPPVIGLMGAVGAWRRCLEAASWACASYDIGRETLLFFFNNVVKSGHREDAKRVAEEAVNALESGIRPLMLEVRSTFLNAKACWVPALGFLGVSGAVLGMLCAVHFDGFAARAACALTIAAFSACTVAWITHPVLDTGAVPTRAVVLAALFPEWYGCVENLCSDDPSAHPTDVARAFFSGASGGLATAEPAPRGGRPRRGEAGGSASDGEANGRFPDDLHTGLAPARASACFFAINAACICAGVVVARLPAAGDTSGGLGAVVGLGHGDDGDGARTVAQSVATAVAVNQVCFIIGRANPWVHEIVFSALTITLISVFVIT